jgi:uracil-DNA glycosylase
MLAPFQIDDSWKQAMAAEFTKPYFENILQSLSQAREAGKIIYPKEEHLFAALNYCTLADVKVVILGQDPYHGHGQAHGLCFSVQKGVAIPPSLLNIYKELKSDLNLDIPMHGCLTHWAKQGVLLLNTSLTVEAHQPMSHSKIGWEQFTDAVIKKVSDVAEHVVFILWGGFARKKKILIDSNKHYIHESAHPSPLSAYNGFWNSKPFSTANNYLTAHNKKPIDWQIKDF